MINLITDLISFTQPTNLDRESLSVIESIAKIKKVVNECITQFNNLEEKTEEDYNKFLKQINDYKNYIENLCKQYRNETLEIIQEFKELIKALEEIEETVDWIKKQSEFVQELSKINQDNIDKGTIATKDEINKINLTLKDIVNIKEIKCDDGEYVKGDGIHDDTSGFINALQNNKSIKLTQGTYRITQNITIPSKTFIYGDGDNSVLFLDSENITGLITEDKAYHIQLKNFRIKGNENLNGINGIHLVCTTNDGLTEYDVKHVIDNVNIEKCTGTAFEVDKCCRECRILNVKAYNGGKGFNIKGTDNFISGCTAGEMEGLGFYINNNNKCTLLKAFCCGKTTYENGFIIESYVNMDNICSQQNCGSGILVKGRANNINIISDSNGFNNLTNAYGIIVQGQFNVITGTVIDGKLNGSIVSALNILDSAVYNDINIGFQRYVYKNADYPNSVEIKSNLKQTMNNIIINCKKKSDVNSIAFKNLLSYNGTDNYDEDSLGSATKINENEFKLTLSNSTNLNSGYGSTHRYKISDLNTNNNKYMVACANISQNGDNCYSALLFSNPSPTNIGKLLGTEYITRNTDSDYILIYDLTDKPDAELWLALFKNTNEVIDTPARATFKNVNIYFTD